MFFSIKNTFRNTKSSQKKFDNFLDNSVTLTVNNFFHTCWEKFFPIKLFAFFVCVQKKNGI